MPTLTIPTRGEVQPQVFYSTTTIALHLIGRDADGRRSPAATSRLVEVTREGAEGIANAQTLRAMARGPEMFDLISKIARHGITAEDFATLRKLDHEITG